MFYHVCVLRKCFLAHGTFVWFESIVNKIMALQISQLRESLVANLTNKRAVAGVGLGVLPHRAVTRELLAAYFALELILSQMFGAMLLHFIHSVEALSALWTLDFVEID